MQRPTWAEIHLDNLLHNYRTIKSLVAPGVKVMAVVKADAYGHGAVPAAKALEAEGVDFLGVALPEEGMELRAAGIKAPILCFGGFWGDQAPMLIDNEITPVIYRLDAAIALNEAARARSKPVNYHLKIDTGMGRLGIPSSEVKAFAERLKEFKRIKLDGVMTHFACADEPDKNDFTLGQIERFNQAFAAIESLGFQPTYRHLANSAGTHAHPQSWGNLVRSGGMLYGLWRDIIAPVPAPPPLKPVMSLHSSIAYLKRVPKGASLGYGCSFQTERESLIATLPIGYADGYRRAHSNNGQVIVRGQFAPVVGRVSMDLTIIDVTDVAGAQLDDEVVLMGEQGGLSIFAENLARQIGTISFEITCNISGRVPRMYKMRNS